MRKVIFLALLCSCSTLPLSAQNQIDINVLLDRLSENHIGSVCDVFSPQELTVLKNHMSQASAPAQAGSRLLDRVGTSTQVTIPVRVVEIDPTNTSILLDLGPSTLPDFEGAGIAITQINTTVIVDNSNRIFVRGLGTNNYTDTGIDVNTVPGESITGMERLSTGEVFAVGTNGVDSSHLYRLDPVTWITTLIGGNNGLALPLSLGRDGLDRLVVLNGDDDNLYRMDAVSGAVSLLGPAGFDANFGQGMGYDATVDALLMAAFNNTTIDSELRSVNVDTGQTTLLGIITPAVVDQFGYVSWYDQDKLGTNNPVFESFEFYPNPARDVLNLKAQFTIERVSITDISGKTILVQDVNDLNAEVNIASLPVGLYIVNVEMEGDSAPYKFIKQ
jgi:hypothetical protein